MIYWQDNGAWRARKNIYKIWPGMFGPDGERPGRVYETVTFFLGMAKKNSLFIPIKIKYLISVLYSIRSVCKYTS